ncbi:MAG: acetate/propionate family kinase, partial [Planctomycetaceae bacterium]|nr:acetate/propionate family kinase [Planctomycetaceae bacterium]
IEIYVHRLRQAIAAMAASMAGLDVLVFTGGVGEHATEIRQAVCEPLGFLGVQLAENRNETSQPDCEISDVTSQVRVFTIAAREDLMLAREACAMLE